MDAPAPAAKTRGPNAAQRLRRAPLSGLPPGFKLDAAIAQRESEVADQALDRAQQQYNFATQLEEQFPEDFPSDPALARERLNYLARLDKSYTGGSLPTGSKGNVFSAAFKGNFIADPNTRRREVAESLFPGDEGGPQRVGEVNGQTVYLDDDGQLKSVTNGLVGAAAGLAAYSPEIVGSGVASIATASPVVASGAGGAAGRAVKRGISNLVFDEPVSVGSVAKEAAIEGAVAAGGATLGKGITAVRNTGRALDYTPRTPQQIRAAEEAIEKVRQSTGIELDLAQATGDRVLLGLRDFVSRYPGKSAQLIQQADQVNAGKLDEATRSFIDSVARAAPSEVVGQKGVNTAQMLIRATREKASQRVAPLYEAAYQQVPEIKNPRFLAMLKLPYFDKAFAEAKQRALLKGIKYDGKPVDLRIADYTKQALDDLIEQLKSDPASKSARTTLEALVPRRNEYVKFLDSVSGDKYKLARDEYGKIAKQTIEPLTNGVVGTLSRIRDPQVARAAAKVLSDQNVSPGAISYARAQLELQQPGSWDGMVRQYLSQQWAKANKPSQGGAVVNPAGKFYQQLFSESNRDRTRAMLPPSARESLETLMVAMQGLAKTPLGANRVAGSNTFRDIAINDDISQAVKGARGATERPLQTALDLVFGTTEAAKQKAFERFTNAILDPAKRDQLKAITKLSPGVEQATLLSALLATETGAAAADRQEPLSAPQRARAARSRRGP
jgi:hypothetical protein